MTTDEQEHPFDHDRPDERDHDDEAAAGAAIHDPEPPRWRFGVITKVPALSIEDLKAGKAMPRGNLATAMGAVFLDPQATGGAYDDPVYRLGQALGEPMMELHVLVPNFTLGELLVMPDGERDQLGRKPSKWDVTCETFDTADEAAARALEVTRG